MPVFLKETGITGQTGIAAIHPFFFVKKLVE